MSGRVAPAAAQPAAPVCVRNRPAAPPLATPPATWNDFEIEGELADPADTVRTLFAPVMQRRTSLTDDTRNDILGIARKYGYFLVAITTRETPAGSHAVLKLAPLPLVRKVNVDIKQSPFATLLDDQVRRRMRIRTGTYLPWTPAERTCELDDEVAQIADYLHLEEGYFDATVATRSASAAAASRSRSGSRSATSTGPARSRSPTPRCSPRRRSTAPPWSSSSATTSASSVSRARFTRTRHIEDIQKVVKLFQRRGYPAVRVHTSSSRIPRSAFNRRTHAVDFTVTIDPRRRIDVKFVGAIRTR